MSIVNKLNLFGKSIFYICNGSFFMFHNDMEMISELMCLISRHSIVDNILVCFAKYLNIFYLNII